MVDFKKAILDTVNNQNEISEFAELAAGSVTAGVPETKNELKQAAPVVQIKKRGRGRPKGSQTKKGFSSKKSFIPQDELGAAEIPSENSDLRGLEPGQSDLQRRNAAKGATMLVQTSGMLLAADEGKMNGDEFSTVEENFDRYFEAKGISDFPPGISLGLALGGYYVRVLTAEKTRPKMALFLSWVKNKLFFLKKKKPEVKPENQDNGA